MRRQCPRWPRLKAAEQAARVGLRTAVHVYIDVTDNGENLVCKLGLQTVPTHVLVDSSGQVRTEPLHTIHPDDVTTTLSSHASSVLKLSHLPSIFDPRGLLAAGVGSCPQTASR